MEFRVNISIERKYKIVGDAAEPTNLYDYSMNADNNLTPMVAGRGVTLDQIKESICDELDNLKEADNAGT